MHHGIQHVFKIQTDYCCLCCNFAEIFGISMCGVVCVILRLAVFVIHRLVSDGRPTSIFVLRPSCLEHNARTFSLFVIHQ